MKRIVLAVCVFSVLASTVLARSPIRCALPPHKIQRIVIPEVEFTNAPLSAVVDYIREASVEFDPADDPREDKGIDLVVVADDEIKAKPITLKLRYVVLSKLLSHVCELADLKFRTEGRSIVLSKDDGPIIARLYDILPSVFPESHTGGTDVSGFFSRFGVPFPEGATAQHLPEIGKVFVGNTAGNLNLLEQILSCLNVVHSQIEISCRAVRVDSPSLAEGTWRSPPVTNMPGFIAEADTLFWFTTAVSSGQTVSNRLTCPIQSSKSASVLSDAVLQFRPSVSPEGQIITIPFTISLGLPFEKAKQIDYSMSSMVSLYNGATFLFWLSPSAGADDDRMSIAVLLSARLIDPAGRPITEQPLNILEAITE